MNRKENGRVEHPAYYNSHPSGVECIDVIRHYLCDIANALKYLWRAGLKTEIGMSISEKESEDLMKSVWYLRDYLGRRTDAFTVDEPPPHPSGLGIEDIASCYTGHIGQAIRSLWYVGLVVDGKVIRLPDEERQVRSAIECITLYVETFKH